MPEKEPIINEDSINSLVKYFIDFIGPNSDTLPSHNFTEQDKKLAYNYVLCAERDFKASRILYDSGDFPNAIYHLQQAVEKLAKGRAAQYYPLHLSEIRQTFHNSPEIFLKLLKKDFINKNLLKFKKIFPNLDFSLIDNLNNNVVSMKKPAVKKEMASIPSSLISDILNMFDHGKFQETLEKSLRPDGHKNIIDLITIIAKNYGVTEKEINNFDISSTILILKDPVSNFFQIDILLYSLAVITFPHEAFSRYPDGKMTPDDYRKELGIVTSFEKVFKTGFDLCQKVKETMTSKS